MNFDAFLCILEGKFYVPRRMYFKDANEKGEVQWNRKLALCYVGENAPSPNPQYVKVENERKGKEYQVLQKSAILPTSCWRIDTGEDYLMWKSYTDRCGICIRTTLGQLVNAIDFKGKGYLPICSPMFYEGINIRDGISSAIMSKDRFYASENEIRFCFVRNDSFIHENLSDLDIARFEALLKNAIEEENTKCATKEKDEKGITFDIRPDFIDSIVLSPFILPSSTRFIKKLLQTTYPKIFHKERLGMIKESEIKINY